MEFKYLAIGICVALGLFLLITEARRKRKAQLFLRLVASTIAVLCFYFLLYPPVYSSKKTEGAVAFNLLTAGTSTKDLKGLSYSIDDQVFKDYKKSGVRYISDLEYFLQSNPDLQEIHIYGYGLSSDQLQLLKGKLLSFHQEPEQGSLTALNWNAQLKATEQLNIQGTYRHIGPGSVKLLLEGLGTKLDSVSIVQNGAISFSLTTRPQQAGKAVFRLIGLKEKDTLFSAPVPLEIKSSDPVRVLMLASNPDFEYKFLKNWLYEKQYPLIFRTRISKDKYSTDFLNTTINEIHSISPALLSKMDLLILDEEELAQLSGAELSNVKRAVEAGLGLFIRASTLKGNVGTGLGTDPGRYELTAIKNKALRGGFVGQTGMLSPLPLEQSLFLKHGAKDLPLFQEAEGKILVSSSIYGMGRQTLSVLPATYQWLLMGSNADYAQFWSEMLHKTARATEVPQTWSISPAVPTLGERINVSIALPQKTTLPQFKIENIRMAPIQNRELPGQWQLNTWATQQGWNTLSSGNNQDFFYVYAAEDWQQLKDAQKQLATSQFVKAYPISTNVLKSSVLLEEKLSLWWFFIPLLISVSFLWYETKML
ncbi:hypothetical protein [Pedobacter gandavensis]|uniref:hypothetical protein n=1 Tax=Pedobacter gandavensis TaxID=2679963 RepID=UPI00292D070F|nr:hypothetical protein [Pedobacter gandavensis]